MAEVRTEGRETRVLVVDDDKLLCAGIAAILHTTQDLRVVHAVHDGADVPQAVAAHRPDVVLIDVRMPVVDGITATRQMLEISCPPRIVVMTTFEGDDTVMRALAAGADGFLLKADDPREIIEAVRAAAAGNSPLSAVSARSLVRHVGPGSRAALVSRASELAVQLTERERQVAGLVGEGLTNAQIAARLYVSEATVKTQLADVQRKWECDNRTQVAVLADRAGLTSDG
ncbi:response regulator [Kytococcus sedentarius]|uniref:response regulator n=1 Tax=Kytococcus sedentarius TaxID=1276 RepID=UPI0035BC849B